MDPTLLGIFEAEQREHIERLRALLGSAAGGAALPPAALDEALRRAHTLKGAARAVGMTRIELLVHRLEALFARLRDGALELDGPAWTAIHNALDAAEDSTAAVLAGGEEPENAAALAALETLVGMTARPRPEPSAPAAAVLPEGPGDIVRVSNAHLDRLVASSSQLLAASAHGPTSTQLDRLLRRAGELQREWEHVRGEISGRMRLENGGPGPAPLAESIRHLDGGIHALTREVRALRASHQREAWELNRLAAQVYDDSCRVRMTPAETVFGNFRRMVRELASGAGKEVEFRVHGLEVQADRLVLQALKDPVMHLLRNAVSHGIETPAERAAAGKPEIGVVELRIEAQGDRLAVTVSDDGRGIDLARVREIAIRRGLLSADDESGGEPDRVASLLLSPGFTTSGAVTPLAGRGIGLSVVEQQVSRIQGSVEFRLSGRTGAAVALSAPLSVSLHDVVLVAAGGQRYAFPNAGVERLYRVPLQNVESVDGNDVIRTGAGIVPVAGLAALLGTAGGGDEPAPNGEGEEPVLHVAVLRAGESRGGVVVDRLLDTREVVVKDLGLPPDAMRLSTGAIALEDGGVAVVLSPAAVLKRFRQAGKQAGVRRAQPQAARPPATILVVDDSITTRSLEKSILEAHGYRVRLAVDGVEALEQLRAAPADLVISDVAMPRMTGFELLENMKKDRQLAAVPVILVTSLEDRRDQERGLSLGADAYIVKRKFDQKELLAAVRQIL